MIYKKVLLSAFSGLLCIMLAGCSVETAKTHDEKLNQSETVFATESGLTEKTSMTEKSSSSVQTTAGSLLKTTASATAAQSTQAEGTENQQEIRDNEDNKAKDVLHDDDPSADMQQTLPPSDITTQTKIKDEKKISVNISISCRSAIDNWDKLRESAKNNDVVPASGVILDNISLSIPEDSTVFSVLMQACSDNNIKMDYSGSEKRKTVYITGINGLYEKDCGSMSGWVYTVNGERVMTGVGGYNLSDGDTVEFLYTV